VGRYKAKRRDADRYKLLSLIFIVRRNTHYQLAAFHGNVKAIQILFIRQSLYLPRFDDAARTERAPLQITIYLADRFDDLPARLLIRPGSY